MIASLLMLICALTLSVIAGFYSVIGMTAIFSASFVPVLLMTGGLEASKVITASWLYNNWRKTPILLRSYLTAAVVILMFITSLGIFGFLSKAHIEQTGAAREGAARIGIIDTEIQRQRDVIARAESAIKAAETKGSTGDAEIQSQIDREQSRIDSINSRIQPAIDEQNAIIAKEEQRLGGSLTLLEDQVKAIDADLSKLDQYLTEGNISMAQGLVGAPIDGKVGGKTSKAVAAYREAKTAEKRRIAAEISDRRAKLASPVIDAAREEIRRLRANAEAEVSDSTALIARLRSQIGKAAATVDVDKVISTETPRIEAATAKINQLTEEKYDLEANARRLEVEVGPIKYVAQLIYGDAIDESLLEKAVRWVIILIIAVFDPLAVLMLIAANQGLNEWRADLSARWKERRKRKAAAAPVEPTMQAPADTPRVDAVPAAAPVGDDRLDRLSGQVSHLLSLLEARTTQTSNPVEMPSDAARAVAAPLPADDAIVADANVQPIDPPMPRQPVREDDIPSSDSSPEPQVAAESGWQLIDRLPIVEPSKDSQRPDVDLPATTDELFEGLASRRDAALGGRGAE
jgi:hypothetical protein